MFISMLWQHCLERLGISKDGLEDINYFQSLVTLVDFSWGCQGSRFSAFRSQGPRTHFQIHFYPFLNINKCSYNFLLSCRIKLRMSSGFPFLGIQNPLPVPVSGNPESVPGFRFGFPFLGIQSPLRVPIPKNPELVLGFRSQEPRTRSGFLLIEIWKPEVHIRSH